MPKAQEQFSACLGRSSMRDPVGSPAHRFARRRPQSRHRFEGVCSYKHLAASAPSVASSIVLSCQAAIACNPRRIVAITRRRPWHASCFINPASASPGATSAGWHGNRDSLTALPMHGWESRGRLPAAFFCGFLARSGNPAFASKKMRTCFGWLTQWKSRRPAGLSGTGGILRTGCRASD